jgi:ribonuclease P protein component
MFPSEQRIHTGKNVLHVLRRGERRSFACVTAHFLAKPGSLVQAAVVIDSKVAKHAVTRNLMKRRVRAYLQNRGLPQGRLIIRLSKGAPDLSYSELIGNVERCLRKLGL